MIKDKDKFTEIDLSKQNEAYQNDFDSIEK